MVDAGTRRTAPHRAAHRPVPIDILSRDGRALFLSASRNGNKLSSNLDPSTTGRRKRKAEKGNREGRRGQSSSPVHRGTKVKGYRGQKGDREMVYARRSGRGGRTRGTEGFANKETEGNPLEKAGRDDEGGKGGGSRGTDNGRDGRAGRPEDDGDGEEREAGGGGDRGREAGPYEEEERREKTKGEAKDGRVNGEEAHLIRDGEKQVGKEYGQIARGDATLGETKDEAREEEGTGNGERGTGTGVPRYSRCSFEDLLRHPVRPPIASPSNSTRKDQRFGGNSIGIRGSSFLTRLRPFSFSSFPCFRRPRVKSDRK